MRDSLIYYFADLAADDRRDVLAEIVEALDADRHVEMLGACTLVAPQLTERMLREHRRDAGAATPPPAQAPTLRDLGLAIEYAPGAQLPGGSDRHQILEILLDGHIVAGKPTDRADRVVLRGRGQHRHVGAVAARHPDDATRLVVISVDTRRHRFGS